MCPCMCPGHRSQEEARSSAYMIICPFWADPEHQPCVGCWLFGLLASPSALPRRGYMYCASARSAVKPVPVSHSRPGGGETLLKPIKLCLALRLEI